MCVICIESIYEKVQVDFVFHSGGQEQCCVSSSISTSLVDVFIDNVVPQIRSPKRIFTRPAFSGPGVQHPSFDSLCRIYSNANSIVSYEARESDEELLNLLHSNMFLNYIGKPSLYLPFCMMVWGAISILTGEDPIAHYQSSVMLITRCRHN